MERRTKQRKYGIIMKYLKTYNIFEKSTLTALGVPTEVMRKIEYNYEISKDARWNRLNLKKELKEELKKDEVALFIEISIDYIKVIVNLTDDEYYIQYFKYNDKGWGEYEVRQREQKTRTQLLIGVNSKHLIYKLDGEFKLKPKAERKLKKEMTEFDNTTTEFKFHMLNNFNKIVRKIYGKRYNIVMQKIANNLANVKAGSSAEEILQFLKDNKKLAQVAKEYEDAKNDDDLLQLKRLEKKYNSLPILDEYLLNFEDGYSNKYDNRLNISDLINDFGRMKIETAFLYYLFTGNLKELTVQKKK